MHWPKRGFAPAEPIFYIAYLTMTFAVIMSLWYIPSKMIDAAVQPYNIDAAIMEQRIYSNLDAYDPMLGVQIGTLRKDPENMKFSVSEKAFAVKATLPGKELYINKEFYKDAWPLTPARYEPFESTKSYQKDTVTVQVSIQQAYPPTYETLT